MSWEIHSEAEKIADGWLAELDTLRKRNGELGLDMLRLRAENAKLRKLVVRLMGHVRHPPCDGCSFECDGTDLTRCDEWSFMEADARDLGVKEAGE